MMTPVLLALLSAVCSDAPARASEEVIVRQGKVPVVHLQARLDGEYLLIRAKHHDGWHTYAMDNERRAKKALAGKKSLGIEQGIEIDVLDGMELEGPWFQPPPTDLSKPELRWYTYGFDETVWFARRVKAVTSDDARVRVRGQACSGDTCCQVDATLTLPIGRPVDVSDGTQQVPRVATILEQLTPVEPQGRSQTAGNVLDSSP